jgi:hypothetical protein
MVLVVAPAAAGATLGIARARGLDARVVGEVAVTDALEGRRYAEVGGA